MSYNFSPKKDRFREIVSKYEPTVMNSMARSTTTNMKSVGAHLFSDQKKEMNYSKRISILQNKIDNHTKSVRLSTNKFLKKAKPTDS